MMILEANEMEIIREGENEIVPNIAGYVEAEITNPDQIINNMRVSEFVDSVNAIYVRKNLFKLPTGKAGKEFINRSGLYGGQNAFFHLRMSN